MIVRGRRSILNALSCSSASGSIIIIYMEHLTPVNAAWNLKMPSSRLFNVLSAPRMVLQEWCQESAFPSFWRNALNGLPKCAALTCASPATNIWMRGIPPCRITARGSQQRSVLGSCFGRYNFRIDLFDLPTTDSYLSFCTHLSDTRPILVARYAPSDAPELLYTSTHVVVVAHIAVAES